MKRLLQWMIAATLICGTTVFTACSSGDDDVKEPPVQPEQPDDDGGNAGGDYTYVSYIERSWDGTKVVEKELIARLQARYNKNSNNIIWDFDPDNIVSISKADIMISDFSSITLDFAFLRDKPFLAAVGDFDPRPYDAGKVPHPLWQFQVLSQIGKELKEKDFPRIGDIIKNIADDPAASENRRLAKEKAWREAHREQLRAQNAAYNAAHRQERRDYQKAYDAAHREEIRMKDRARYAAKKRKEKEHGQ